MPRAKRPPARSKRRNSPAPHKVHANGASIRGAGLALENSLLQLIRRTAVDIPADVEGALRTACAGEPRGSHGRAILETVLENIRLARQADAPLCQDTGGLLFYVQVPAGWDTNCFASAAGAAISRATQAGLLRQNTIDSVTGQEYPLNLAAGSPTLHFSQAARSTMDVRLVIKGGGSENVGCQYSLPNEEIGAGRDLDGVRRCMLDAAFRAQGQGCAPGVLGVCIGGDRAGGYAGSKEQFLRKMGDRSPVAALAALEEQALHEANQLGIGPMGLGGKTTLLGVKIGNLSRVPASFFVSISYMCWAFRRRGVLLESGGGIIRWLY